MLLKIHVYLLSNADILGSWDLIVANTSFTRFVGGTNFKNVILVGAVLYTDKIISYEFSHDFHTNFKYFFSPLIEQIIFVTDFKLNLGESR